MNVYAKARYSRLREVVEKVGEMITSEMENAVFRTKDLASALKAKGFHETNRHHRYYHLYVNGLKTSVWTKISHGIPEYGGTMLSVVRKQMHLTRNLFGQFIDCTMTDVEYAACLCSNGRVKLK